MGIFIKKHWRVNGPITDEEFEWVRKVCYSAEYHQETSAGFSFFRRTHLPPISYVLCSTVSEKQETLLVIRFSDRCWQCDDTGVWQE